MNEVPMSAVERLGLFFEQVWAVIRHFDKITDTLDILFIALVIYGLIRLIRETRSIQLFKGLFWLALAGGITGLLKMQAAVFIFDQAMRNIVVIIVVLFQPEIRTVFERLGRSTVVNNLRIFSAPTRTEFEREEIESGIHQVCEACREFSAGRTGALIVFERVTMLGDIIKTGTVVDAKISSQLVGNVFYAGSPLHDGAAIVRKGRLEAAGCILPLTENRELDSVLGTRHRAALGMSEQSDAMVAVVSEETGLISLAYKGVLRRGLSPEDLGEALLERLLNQESARRRFTFKRRGKEGAPDEE